MIKNKTRIRYVNCLIILNLLPGFSGFRLPEVVILSTEAGSNGTLIHKSIV